MPKYKNIKSVAHNLGYSFLSDMNFVGTASPVTMVPDALFQAARAADEPVIEVDLLRGTIAPPAVAIEPVAKSVGHYVSWLPQLAASQSVTPSMITAATLTLRFDFAGTQRSKYHPHRELPAVECRVVITDDRGMRHVAQPKHWCYR